jgi:hypothetical protein
MLGKKIHPTEQLFENDFHNHWEKLLNEPIDHQHRTPQEEEQERQEDKEDTASETEVSEGEKDDEEFKLDEVSQKVNTLLLQMEEIRKKFIKETELRKKAETTNKELLLKIADLEEDNIEYQGHLISILLFILTQRL